MNWKENLEKASFKDVDFFITGHEVSGGRRVLVHEFPFQDTPSSEDLGKKARSFKLEAFVGGEDYFEKRDALIEACESEGSGILVHPYLGRLSVNCGGYSLHENTENGRVARFSLDFKESGETLQSFSSTNTVLEVARSTNSLRATTLSNFQKIYTVVGSIKSVIQSAKNHVNSVLNELSKVQKLCSDTAQLGHDFSELVKEFSNGLDKIISFPDKVAALFESSFAALSSSIDGLLSKTDPNRIVASASLVSGLSGTLASPHQASTETSQSQTEAGDARRISAWKDLARFELRKSNAFISLSEEGNKDENNRSALALTTQILGFSYLCDCVAEARFSSGTDVKEIHDAIMSLSDDLMSNENLSDELFSNIQSLQVLVSKALWTVENELPKITEITTTEATNTLSFLYENRGSLDAENDLIARNSITDPFYIPQNTCLLVLL